MRGIGSERSAHRQMRHEATWAITVATAAPVMPQWNTSTKTRSSTMLMAAAMIMASSGVRLLPMARRMEANTL